MSDDLITCSKCGLLLPKLSFSKLKKQCKACIKVLAKAYQQTDKYKESQAAYRQTDKCKEYMKAYQQTDKCKEYMKAYQQTDKHKETKKAYQQTDKHKETKKAYQQTDKYKETKKAYQQTDKYKETKRQQNRRARADLHDSYVNNLLCARTTLKPSQIPPAITQIKRLQIKLHRELAQ